MNSEFAIKHQSENGASVLPLSNNKEQIYIRTLNAFVVVGTSSKLTQQVNTRVE